jgi:hypothetical protein
MAPISVPIKIQIIQMNTPTTSTVELSEQQLLEYAKCRRSGQAAAAQVLGGNHHALMEVDAHVLTQLERELNLGKTPHAAYAYRVGYNCALKVLKRDSKHQSLDAAAEGSAEPLRPVYGQSLSRLPSADLELQELRLGVEPLVQALKEAIAQLQEADREFLVAFVVHHNFDTRDYALV